MALARDRMVGLQPGSGAGLRHSSFLSGGSMTLGAGPALEQLKKTADRLVEEQQSTKHATEAYRLKLQEAQTQLANLQQSYAQERTENTQLKAKIKDDQQQIEHVTSKVSMVETMHDGLRLAMAGLRTDVQGVETFRQKLSGSFDRRFADCEAFGHKIEQLQGANVNANEKLTAALHHCEELREHIVHLTTSMEHSDKEHHHERSRLATDLHLAETSVAEHHQAHESLKAELSRLEDDLSELQTGHASEAEQNLKQISKLEDDLQAARLHTNTVECDLKNALARASTSEEAAASLNHTINELQTQLQAGSDQAESLKADLLAKIAEQDALVANHSISVDKCQELSVSLKQSEEALQAKVADFQQAMSSLEAEKAFKEALSDEHEQRVKEVIELQSLITSAGEVAATAQESHAGALAALQTELANSKQETAAAKADAVLSAREAVVGADKKVQRLTERTAKELEDYRKKCKAEAEKEQKKMQSQLLTLKEEKKALDAKLAQEHHQLEAAITQHKAMSDQIQQITNSLEQKCRDEVAKADQKMAQLQGEYTTETTALCAKQQLELQSALDAAVKQQEAVASVEMRMSQLKIDHEQLMTQHTQEKEASLKQAEEAKNAAVEEVQSVMDARVKDLLGDLSECQRSLEATSSKLQRNEMSVDAAQLELDNLKGHAREQESVIDSLQEQLQANQALLGTISRAANQHAKPAGPSPAPKESPSGRRKASESKRSPVYESVPVSKRTHKSPVAPEEHEQPDEEYCDKGRSRRGEVQPAPEVRRKNPPPRFTSSLKTPEAAHDSSEEGEQEAPSDDGGDEEEEERERVYQVEKEKRKRAASKAPKQRLNKKGRADKPAVTQGRRSKFTAMSAQTMTSEDDDADTYQHRRKVSKADRNVAISARAKQPVTAAIKRLPANGKHKKKQDLTSTAAGEMFGEISLDPYAFA